MRLPFARSTNHTLVGMVLLFAASPALGEIVFRDDFRGADSGVADGEVLIKSPTGWIGSHPARTDPFEGTGNVYVNNKSAGWVLGGETSRDTVILQTFGSTHTTIKSGSFFTASGAGTIDFSRAGRSFLGGSGEGTLAVFVDETQVHTQFLAYNNNTYLWANTSVSVEFVEGLHTITFKWSGQAPYAGREDSSVAIDWVQVSAPIPTPATLPLIALSCIAMRRRRA